MSQPVVAEIVRSGFVEGHHYGAVVALAPDGSVDWSVGDVRRHVLPRSCNKPVQALAMVRAGLDLPPDLLALACASHSGEPIHVVGVRRILAGCGLDESALRTPPDYPIDEATMLAAVRAGAERAPIFMNCSGKHAAMLATCVVNGWDVDGYPDPAHPLQAAIARTIEEFGGEPGELAVDGCGAPALSMSLVGLARSFSRVALGRDGKDEDEPAAGRIAEAIRAHPEYVSGTTRDERALIAAIPGAIAKIGAESCYAVALPDGRAFALKCDDGATRVRPALMTAALLRSGIDREPGVDAATLRRLGEVPVLGGGHPVGVLRPVLD